MSDTDPPPTSRACPACGLAPDGDGERPSCRLCGGSGLATPGQITAWRERQRVRRSSTTTKSIPLQVQEGIVALRRRDTRFCDAMAESGEGLLRHFTHDPLSEATLTELVDWITRAKHILRGDR